MSKKKKNRTVTTRTTESGYFHTGNSGITLSVNEIEHLYHGRSSEVTNEPERTHTYRLEARHGAFGSYTQVSLPLGSLHLVEYLIQSLTRTRDRMARNGFSHEYAFGSSAKTTADDYVEIIDGLTRNAVHKEYVSGPNSTVTKIVGYDYYDGDQLVRTDMLKLAIDAYGEGSDGNGGKPRFSPDQIGREIVDGAVVDPPGVLIMSPLDDYYIPNTTSI